MLLTFVQNIKEVEGHKWMKGYNNYADVMTCTIVYICYGLFFWKRSVWM